MLAAHCEKRYQENQQRRRCFPQRSLTPSYQQGLCRQMWGWSSALSCGLKRSPQPGQPSPAATLIRAIPRAEGVRAGNNDQRCRMPLISGAAPSSSANCSAITWENLRTRTFPLLFPLLINWCVPWVSLQKANKSIFTSRLRLVSAGRNRFLMAPTVFSRPPVTLRKTQRVLHRCPAVPIVVYNRQT